jgi:hypothetical protein
MGRLVVFGATVAGATAVFAAAAQADTVKAIGCSLPGWPASVVGVPSAFRQSSSRGYFVWRDRTGWHLRARVASQPLSGRISASAVLRVTKMAVAASDRVSVTGRSVGFRFSGKGAKRIDFRVGCSRSVSFALGTVSEGAGVGAPVESPPVYLGARGRAARNLFRLSRPLVSGVEGWLTAGPACPTEGGPGADCSPTRVRGTIRIEPVAASRTGGPVAVALTVQTNPRGFFHAALPPGVYRLKLVKTEAGFPLPPAQRVEVQPGVTVQLTLVLDTGVR